MRFVLQSMLLVEVLWILRSRALKGKSNHRDHHRRLLLLFLLLGAFNSCAKASRCCCCCLLDAAAAVIHFLLVLLLVLTTHRRTSSYSSFSTLPPRDPLETERTPSLLFPPRDREEEKNGRFWLIVRRDASASSPCHIVKSAAASFSLSSSMLLL
jgi:hypothetical protein